MLHLLQYYQNDSTFSPSLYSVPLCDNIGLVLLILMLAMLFCHSSYCTMCIIHPDLVSVTFYTIPISPLCNLNLLVILQLKPTSLKYRWTIRDNRELGDTASTEERHLTSRFTDSETEVCVLGSRSRRACEVPASCRGRH